MEWVAFYRVRAQPEEQTPASFRAGLKHLVRKVH